MQTAIKLIYNRICIAIRGVVPSELLNTADSLELQTIEKNTDLAGDKKRHWSE